MKHAVMMGDPKYFRIKNGQNPYTRNAWGFRKRVNTAKAIDQWKAFKETLESLDAHTLILPAQKAYPGLVFPANAGFVYPKYEVLDWEKKRFYLSHLIGRRSHERLVYHQMIRKTGFDIHTAFYIFEGEADFFPCGEFYIFSYGKIVPTGFRQRKGFPPWYYRFSHRSDAGNKGVLQEIVGKTPIIRIRLMDTRYYHGDVAMFAFGPNREYLLAYLEAMDKPSRERLAHHLGDRLIPLSKKDAENFVANSFQMITSHGPHVIFPVGVSEEVKKKVTDLGIPITEVDVSEFAQKGGGSIKCLLCDLGPYLPST